MNTTIKPIGLEVDFEAFYRKHFRGRVAQVTKTVGNHHDAEDIVQVSFVELARAWHEAEHPERLLSTIIHRQTCKHWRRQPFAKGIRETTLGNEAEQVRARVPDPAVVAEQRDIIRRVGEEISLRELEIVAGRFHHDTVAVIASASGTHPDKLRQSSRRMEQRMSMLVEPPVEYLPTDDTRLRKYSWMLPRRQCEVFRLALKGLSSAQIARDLKITTNCASANLTHAKKTITAMLHSANHVDAAYAVNRQLWQARRRWAENLRWERETFEVRARQAWENFVNPHPCIPGG